MNWYNKFIFSSHNLRFPPEVESQVNLTVEKILNFYKTFKELPEWLVSSEFGDIDYNIINILKIPQPLFGVLNKWKINKPEILKTLRQRIHKSIMENKDEGIN